MRIEYLYQAAAQGSRDAFILGSGASMNYFKPTDKFFNNKMVIGVNTIFEHYPVDFTVIQHHDLLDYVNNKPIRPDKFVISKHHKGILSEAEISDFYKASCWIFEHNEQSFLNTLDFTALDDPNKLVVGSTTVIAALSFAYHLGAKNIFLCGIDGGSIDGETNLKDYYQSENAGNKVIQHKHSVLTNMQIANFRTELKRRGVNIFSINPFVNMSFEGHKFSL